jgi:hypothetical protein
MSDWAELAYVAVMMIGLVWLVSAGMRVFAWVMCRVALWWTRHDEADSLARIADAMERWERRG